MNFAIKSSALFLAMTASVMADDGLRSLASKGYGVSVTREKSIKDYAAMERFKSQPTESIRILVTTEDLSPIAEDYQIAKAFHSALIKQYPKAEFKVGGKVDNREFAAAIKQQYDYLVLIGTNSETTDYQGTETTYGTKSDEVKCTGSMSDGSVTCKEQGAAVVPIGTRPTTRSIYTDLFYVRFAEAAQVTPAWTTPDYKPQITVNDQLTHTYVRIKYGDSQYCANSLAAQALLARFTANEVQLSEPDKVSFNATPKKLKCDVDD